MDIEQQLFDKLKEHKMFPKKSKFNDPGINDQLMENSLELIRILEDKLEAAYAEIAGDDY